ncbi:hypothetical protein G9A89_001574 [Geosiphon pyriformis]|nr:hypothetical protein G9A89_001574 [Geosiphon pyriformis]
MNNSVSLGVGAVSATKEDMLSVLNSDKFSEVCDSLLEMWSDCIEVYTNGSLRCASSVKVAGRAAAYFLAVNTDIGVKVSGLLSSTLTELQAVVLALECVSSSCSVILYSDSQSAINACISEAFLTAPDFHNQCWIKRLQIVKVKEHSDVLGNIKTNALANETTSLSLSLPVKIQKRFLVAEKTNLHQLICCVYWEAGLGFSIVLDVMIKEIDWDATVTVWHFDLHMLSEFTSRKSANLRTYLMKTFSDYVFACFGDSGLRGNILVEAAEKWMSMSGLLSSFPSAILLLLSSCSLNVDLYTLVCKSFVIRNWYAEAVSIFERKEKAIQTLVEYIRTKHKVKIEKTGLVEDNGVVSGLFSSVVSTLSASIVHMLGVIKSFAIRFDRCKLCHFFSGLDGDTFVTIGV